MPKTAPHPDYPGTSGNVCNACQWTIAHDGTCGCENPEWNHHFQKPIDPMDRTQILEPTKGLEKFFGDGDYEK